MRSATTSLVAALLMASVVGCGDSKTQTSAGGDKTKISVDGEGKKSKKAPDIITDLTAAKTAGQQWQSPTNGGAMVHLDKEDD